MSSREVLLVVGSNPPSKTDGQRTLLRAQMAREILGFERATVENLFALPSYRSGDISDIGQGRNGWEMARSNLATELGNCCGVLLAYGVNGPAGPARALHREQVEWLDQELRHRVLPTWWVGGAPRHPSRWQRHTRRAFPEDEFVVGLRRSLVSRDWIDVIGNGYT